MEETLGASIIHGMNGLLDGTVSYRPALDLISQYKSALLNVPTSSRTPTPESEVQLEDVMERLEQVEKRLSTEQPLKRRKINATWTFDVPAPLPDRKAIDLAEMDRDEKRKIPGYFGLEELSDSEEEADQVDPMVIDKPSVKPASGFSFGSNGFESKPSVNPATESSELKPAEPKPLFGLSSETKGDSTLFGVSKPVAKPSFGESKSDTKSEAKPLFGDFKSDTKSDAKPLFGESKSDTKSDTKSDAKPLFGDFKSDAKSDAKSDTKSDAKSDAKPAAKPLFGSKADSGASFSFGSTKPFSFSSEKPKTLEPSESNDRPFSFGPAIPASDILSNAKPIGVQSNPKAQFKLGESKPSFGTSDSVKGDAEDTKGDSSDTKGEPKFSFGGALPAKKSNDDGVSEKPAEKPVADKVAEKEHEKPENKALEAAAEKPAEKVQEKEPAADKEPEAAPKSLIFGGSDKPFTFDRPKESDSAFTLGSKPSSEHKSNDAPSEPKPFTFGSGTGASKGSDDSKPFTFGNGNSGAGSGDSKPFTFGNGNSGATGSGEAAKPFTFGTSSGASTGAPFGTSTSSESEAKPSPFGTANSEAKPAFGPSTEAKPAFGSNSEAKPAFGASTEAKPSPFGSSSEAKPAFGSNSEAKPSPFGNSAVAFGSNPTTANPTTAAPFGSNPTSAAPFGSNPTTAAPFGSASTNPSSKEPNSTFGNTNQGFNFGKPAEPNKFSFGNAAAGFSGATSNAFGVNNTNSNAPFAASNGSSAPGSSAPGTSAPANPFGAPFGGSSAPAPASSAPFGTFNPKPSFNFGSQPSNGGFSFGANSGGPAGGPAGGNGGFNFGSNANAFSNSQPNSNVGTPNGSAPSTPNMLATGVSGNTTGRKFAPLRRRLPPKN